MSKLRFEIVHFLVILVLILLNDGGCGGQPLCLKSIPKVKRQMPLPKELYRNGGKDLFTFSAVNLGRMAESKSRGLSVLSTAS